MRRRWYAIFDWAEHCGDAQDALLGWIASNTTSWTVIEFYNGEDLNQGWLGGLDFALMIGLTLSDWMLLKMRWEGTFDFERVTQRIVEHECSRGFEIAASQLDDQVSSIETQICFAQCQIKHLEEQSDWLIKQTPLPFTV